jgi:hypothetical protein
MKTTTAPLNPARDCLALEAVTAGWLMNTVHFTRGFGGIIVGRL